MKKLLTALLIVIPAILFSQLPAPLKNTYVHDYAHMLTIEETEALNKQIKAIDTTNNIKFAIVLINDLPTDYAIEDYARDIGNKWQVGKGIVYVAAINNRKQRLEVSSHLEGVIPDAIAGHILARIKIHFRSKDYYAGLSGMLSEVSALVKADGTIVKPKEEDSNGYAIALILVVFTGVAVWIILVIYRTNKRRKKLEVFEEHTKKVNDYYKEHVNNATNNNKPKTKYMPPDDTSYTSKKNNNDSGSYFSGYSSGSSSSSNDSYSRNNDSSSSYGGYGDSSSSSDSYSGGGASSDW